ncbi:hypothetical protein E7745_05185 [Duncaniella sp. C9]|nr:hypothetical protein E7745_05185 [Duncaniella sp. C9]
MVASIKVSKRLSFRNPRVSESPKGRAVPGVLVRKRLLPRRGWLTATGDYVFCPLPHYRTKTGDRGDYLCGKLKVKIYCAMKKHTRKPLCPVSKNFYSTITDRVRDSLRSVGREDAAEATMGCIDRYMADGTLPPGGSDAATILVFNLLRMEIDKALQRSRRARQRAAERVADAARKHREPAAVAAVSAPAAAEQDVDSDDAEDEEPEPFRPRNRRERRLYEQEVRRAANRLRRRLARQ